jgi:hypothetical protein
MDFHKHPLRFLLDVIEVRGKDLSFSFSKYFYRPGNVFDERETFTVLGADIDELWLKEQLGSLRDGWELALNSKVVDDRNRTHHIGMIDFAPGIDLESIRVQTRRLLGDEMWASMSCYESGRSFHGYFNCLLRPGAWYEFLGRLLLMNEPDKKQVVDARWVGHRLIGGYCALRWSRNSAWHQSYPSRILYSPVSAAAKRAGF